MGKELVPRFKCPLCGWLAYYSMFERGPHKLEIKGMKYGGFQEISYHRVWTGKREYKEYLREKVRELAKELGIKLVDEEEVTDEYEEEVETEPSEVEHLFHQQVEEVRSVEKPSRRVMEMPIERVETLSVEHVSAQPQQRVTTKAKTLAEMLSTYVTQREHVMVSDSDSLATAIDHEFIDLGGG